MDTTRHTWQLHVLILNADEVSVLAQLRLVEVLNGDPQLGQTHEFLPIDACGIREHATPVDDSDCLVRTEQDFICT